MTCNHKVLASVNKDSVELVLNDGLAFEPFLKVVWHSCHDVEYHFILQFETVFAVQL